MFIKNENPVYDFVSSISAAVDLITPGLDGHHKKVTCIAYNIAREMNLSNDEVQYIVLAAMMHDICAFANEESLKNQTTASCDNESNQYAQIGYKLLKNFGPLTKAIALINYYHTGFNKPNPDIPIGGYIIHLADKAAALIDGRQDILTQVPEIFAEISQSQNIFHPEAFAAFARVVKKAKKRPWNINIIKDEIATFGRDFIQNENKRS